MDGNKGRRLLSLGLLLLFTQSYDYVPLASGQQGKQCRGCGWLLAIHFTSGHGPPGIHHAMKAQNNAHNILLCTVSAVGVSLMFFGETLPSDSFVDFDDVLNIGNNSNNIPSNRNPRNESLECITDLVDCCGTESGSSVRTERGNWHFPDGRRIDFDNSGRTRFLANRGPNEVINGQQFYGSVRLFRRYSNIPEKGRFCCELPSAADPSVTQTLYVNICEFFLLNLQPCET